MASLGEWSTIRNLKQQNKRPPFYSYMFGYIEGMPTDQRIPEKTFWKRGPPHYLLREGYAARKTQTFLHPSHAPWRREYYNGDKQCGFDSLMHLTDHEHLNPLGDIGTLKPHPNIQSTLEPHSQFNSSRILC